MRTRKPKPKQLLLFGMLEDAMPSPVPIPVSLEPLPRFMQIGLIAGGNRILDLTQQIKRDMVILEEPEILDHPEFFRERIERSRVTIKELVNASPPPDVRGHEEQSSRDLLRPAY